METSVFCCMALNIQHKMPGFHGTTCPNHTAENPWKFVCTAVSSDTPLHGIINFISCQLVDEQVKFGYFSQELVVETVSELKQDLKTLYFKYVSIVKCLFMRFIPPN